MERENWVQARSSARFGVTLLSLLCSVTLSGCALKSGAGPSAAAINKAGEASLSSADIKIIDVTDEVARTIIANDQPQLLSDKPGDGLPIGSVIGKGDVLDVAIWEAPPAVLFGSSGGDLRMAAAGMTNRATSLPEQMVDTDGQISIPFVGRIQAAGRSSKQLASDITARLVGKAHQPQAIVRIVRNASLNVTVVGEVTRNDRVPLTAKGERLLDVLASSGGVKSPISKTLIQVTRGAQVTALPLQTIINDPRQNIRLQPDDVVTALYQSYSFTALGATGANAEVPFEATGISLAQALGRAGGLQDQRANIKGAFLFRLENPDALDPSLVAGARLTPDGRIPVIYRIDMKNPAIFFSAQSFPVHDKDVIYVSNAPLAEFQKFVNIVSSLIYPVIAIESATNNN